MILDILFYDFYHVLKNKNMIKVKLDKNINDI